MLEPVRYHLHVGRIGALVAVLVAVAASPAFAQKAHLGAPVQESVRPTPADTRPVRATDATLVVALGERWHDVPMGPRLKLSVQITDGLTTIGNLIGGGVGDLSDNMIGLKFDGRKRRAKVHLGNAEGAFLHFAVDTDWKFSAGKARVATKLQLGIGDHHWNVELPDVDVAPTSVYGDRGVEVKIPILEKRW